MTETEGSGQQNEAIAPLEAPLVLAEGWRTLAAKLKVSYCTTPERGSPPRWSDLYGIAPDFTGATSTEEYLEANRRR